MDISKYVTNKELQVSSDDFNIEKLEKDIRKGYVLSDEVDNARKEAVAEINKKYSELEENYNKLQNSYNDIEARNTQFASNEKKLKLDIEMVSQGFKKEQFDEIRALRTSLYGEEQDDAKAISQIKEKYSATYFPNKEVEIPNEPALQGQPTPSKPIEPTRKTSLKDLMIK